MRRDEQRHERRVSAFGQVLSGIRLFVLCLGLTLALAFLVTALMALLDRRSP